MREYLKSIRDLQSAELARIVSLIPDDFCYRWGVKPNNAGITGEYDKQIVSRYFYGEKWLLPSSWVFYLSERLLVCILEDKTFSQELKSYAVKRAKTVVQAEIQERMFARNPGVARNPDEKSKEYDVMINGVPFDLKSTVVPYGLFSTFSEKIRNRQFFLNEEITLAKWFFENQSRQVRYDIQNRLFIVDVSKEYNKTVGLLKDFNNTSDAIRKYCSEFSPEALKTIKVNGKDVLYDFIYLIEGDFGQNSNFSVKPQTSVIR